MRTFYILCTVFLISLTAGLTQTYYHSSHLTAEQVDEPGGLSLQILFVSYTAGPDVPQSVTLCWGDGQCEEAPLISSEMTASFYRRNIYKSKHTYAATGTYQIRVTDCCWTQESLSFFGSSPQEFHLSLDFQFLNASFSGSNSTPELAAPVIDIGNTGQAFIYTPLRSCLDLVFGIY